MFGYIKTYKPEMKIREFDAYKAVYCSLCRQLHKDYGLFARFTLNFDYTFLAMIRMAAIQSPTSVVKGRCPYNPFAKCNNVVCGDDSLSFSAAVAMMMFYYKLQDNRHDEGIGKRIISFLCLPLAALWHKKAARRYPKAEQIIAEFCHQQQLLEQTDTISLDEAAHPTADALASLFSYEIDNDSTRRILAAIGYNVGKWVYLIDALDDFKKDLEKKRFNPYASRLGKNISQSQLTDFAKHQCNVCIDEACAAYALLPKKNFSPIIENILLLGLEQVQKEIIRKVNNHE